MKARLPLLAAAALSFLSLAPAQGADLTWTYTPNKDSTGAQTIGSITITPTYVWKTTEHFGNSSGLQIGKTGQNALSVTYDFSAFPSDIKSIAITGKTAAGNSGETAVSATIGTDACTGTASLTSTEGTITLSAPEGTQTGNLSILISNPKADSNNDSSQAIYLRSIVVTYKDPASAGLTQLPAPTSIVSSDVGYFGFSLSWTGVSDATGYTVTLSPPAGTITVDGTTATVTGLAEGTTYTVSVVAKGDGTTTDDSDAATESVTTATAPDVTAPVLTESGVSSSSFAVSWPAQNDAAFSVRAWTLVPANVATEIFEGFPSDRPTGWTFNTDLDSYNSNEAIVKLDASGESVVSPTYPATASSLSFKLQGHGAANSSVSVSGSSDGSAWTPLTNIVLTSSTKVNDIVLPNLDGFGMNSFKWEFTRVSGGVGFGWVSVTGTGVGKARSYLTGCGSDSTTIPVEGTSVTISNPVAGETNYVEVTATGLTGRTASSTLAVAVPAPLTFSPVIFVK